jgi:hypothetical protein
MRMHALAVDPRRNVHAEVFAAATRPADRRLDGWKNLAFHRSPLLRETKARPENGAVPSRRGGDACLACDQLLFVGYEKRETHHDIAPVYHSNVDCRIDGGKLASPCGIPLQSHQDVRHRQ